jgi:sugar/nucleoside kinase (ribokinase family)
VVLRGGPAGALTLADDAVTRTPALPVTPVDAVGEGDAFAAGFLLGILDGPPDRRPAGAGRDVWRIRRIHRGRLGGLRRRRELGLLTGADVIR